MDIDEWLGRVDKYLPVGERTAVREELTDHYCDRLDALLAQGCGEREAKVRAVDALGDPDRTGKLLRRVHQPWITWLLYGVRFLAFALLLILVMNAGTWNTVSNAWVVHREWNVYVSGRFYDAGVEGSTVFLQSYRKGSCEATGEAAGREISVLAAWHLFPGAAEAEDASANREECYVVLRVDSPCWETESYPYDYLERSLHISADGESFVSYVLYRETMAAAERAEEPQRCFFGVIRLERRFLSCDYLVTLERYGDPASDEEPRFDPDLVELSFEFGETRFTLPVVFGPRMEAEGGKMP